MSRKTGNKRGRPGSHGCFSLLHRLNDEISDQRIRAYLADVRRGLIQDKGGAECLSTGEMLLVDRIVSKLGVLRLVETFCNQHGVMKDGELRPVLGLHYLAYANSVRLDLMALGLKRAEAPGPTLEQYIKANYPADSPTSAQGDQGGAIGSEPKQEDGKS